MNQNSKKAIFLIFFLSFVSITLLIWLVYFRGSPVSPTNSFVKESLPALNALFNLVTSVLLIIGRIKIAQGKTEQHKQFMVSSFLTSCLFLIGYLVYHSVVGETKFIAEGSIRYVYFFILISHIILSFPLLPLVGMTFYFAFTSQYALHKKLARITFPVWLYVSATGVLVFLFLRFLNQ